MNTLRFSRRALMSGMTAVALAGNAAAGVELPAQTTESGGVTIAVKPLAVAAGAPRWSFEVSLGTQAKAQALDDNLLRTAHLLNRSTGKQEAPIAWKAGAPPGQRRTGVLSFKPVQPAPKAIEMRIQRAGEAAPRVFRWDLDCPCNDPKMHPSS